MLDFIGCLPGAAGKVRQADGLWKGSPQKRVSGECPAEVRWAQLWGDEFDEINYGICG